MHLILIILSFLVNLNIGMNQSNPGVSCELLIEHVDTINYWHILIDGDIVLRANQFLNESELEVSLDSDNFPQTIEFDYRTDHGFEYNVDRIIKILDSSNTLIQEFKHSTYEYGETTKISIASDLENYEELIIKCRFYISNDRINKGKTFYNKRMIDKFKDQKIAESFVICKLKKVK